MQHVKKDNHAFIKKKKKEAWAASHWLGSEKKTTTAARALVSHTFSESGGLDQSP